MIGDWMRRMWGKSNMRKETEDIQFYVLHVCVITYQTLTLYSRVLLEKLACF